MKKVGGGRTIRYAGAFEDHVTDGVQVKHLFVGDLRVATRVTGGINAGIYFVHGDHLGGLNVLTNSQGTEVQRLSYQPFGETFTNTGSVDFHQHRFTDQEQDPETGLYFYQARYYNPVLGRFVSPDALVPQPGNPQSLNRYSYVTNNPATLVDPSGQQFEFLSDLFSSVGQFFSSLFSSSPTTSTDSGYASQILLETGFPVSTTEVGITTGVVAAGSGTPTSAAANDPGTGTYQSPSLMRALVPGQAWWDATINATQQGNYGQAGLYASGMLAEQALFAGTLGFSSIGALGTTLDTEVVGLAERAAQIHAVLDPIAQAQRTTAVLESSAGRFIASGARDLTAAQRALLVPGEIAARLPGAHAEMTALEAARLLGATPEAMAVTRVICPQCAAAIQASGGKLVSPTSAIWLAP